MDKQNPTHPPVADLVSIEITYQTDDRFGWQQDADPNIAYVQHVSAEIKGRFDWEQGDDDLAHLGTLSLARIDSSEAGSIFNVLDAQSSEWVAYAETFNEDDVASLLIVDRIELVPWARGHDIGLHVVARAIRTWATDMGELVVLTAYPLGKEGQEGRAGAHKLARYWSRLGLEQVKGTDPPILTGMADYRTLDDRLRELCVLPGVAR